MAIIVKTPCDERFIATKTPLRPVPGAKAGPAVLVATILGSSMVFIDGTVVGVALPAIQRDFSATGARAQWVFESYALFLAALILVGGALGDHFGRKRIFLIGAVSFAATSVWCGLSPTIEILITARAAQGLAGALLTPASLAIISAAYTDETARGRAIGTWSGFSAISAAFGPVLGGWLTENASWRWVFGINVPLAVVVVVVAARGVPESRDEDAGQLDFLGAALATLGLGALVFGLIEGPVRGWGNPLVMGSLVAGAVLLIAFVVAEARVPSPMVPLTLFRSPTFSGANLLTFLLYGAFNGALFWLPFNLIQVQGYSPTEAGAAFVPATVILFTFSRWTGGLVGSVAAKLPLTIGPIIIGVALLLMALPGVGGSYWTTFFPAAVVLGIGLAITVPLLTTEVMSAVSARQAGVASGINNAVARIAGLVAVAFFGVLVTTAFVRGLDLRLDQAPDLSPEIRIEVEANWAELAAAAPPAEADAESATAVQRAIDMAFVDGFRMAMVAGAIMSLLSSAFAWRLIAGKEASGRTAVVPASR